MASSRKRSNKESNTLVELIKACDFYRVMPRELTEPTVTGASGMLFDY
jgi:hypothetical protein